LWGDPQSGAVLEIQVDKLGLIGGSVQDCAQW
jgi:hypothetical protein